MREEDLLRFEWIADPRISPDGTCVAYTRVTVDAEEDGYRTNLWLVEVPAPGATAAPARPLTFSGRDSQPRWSPDGSRLVFVRKGVGKEPGQLHVLPLSGGEALAITSLGKGASSPAWSPDGTRVAFLSGHNPGVDAPEKQKPKNEPARVVTRPEFRWNDEGFFDWEHLDHVWVVDLGGRRATPAHHGNAVQGIRAGLDARRPLDRVRHRPPARSRGSASRSRTTTCAPYRPISPSRPTATQRRWSPTSRGRSRPSPRDPAAAGSPSAACARRRRARTTRTSCCSFEGEWPMTTPRVLTARPRPCRGRGALGRPAPAPRRRRDAAGDHAGRARGVLVRGRGRLAPGAARAGQRPVART